MLETTIERIINHYIPMMSDNEKYTIFFKQEMKCINECLNLLDMNLVGLPIDYIEESRNYVIQSLDKDNFEMLISNKGKEIGQRMKDLFINMSDQEENAFKAFICLFPQNLRGLSSAYALEGITEALVDLGVKEEDIIEILHKYFDSVSDYPPLLAQISNPCVV